MYERSVQEQIDRKMCKPGYTWNKTLQECLPAAVGYVDKPDLELKPVPNLPDSGENGGNEGESGKISADNAIKKEVAMRLSQGLRPKT